MSELDQLRELLIANGMEYREHEAPATDCIAFFDGSGWHDCWESVDGEVNVTFSMTPAQAVEATLGRGTCHMERDNDWHCTECGEHVSTCNEPPRFCPACGAEVVS